MQSPRSGPAIELTFDDGPDPGWTPAVLRALDAIGARATFYGVAPRATAHAGLVRAAAAGGHEMELVESQGGSTGGWRGDGSRK